MSSKEQTIEEFSSTLQRPRKKHRVNPRLLIKWVYVLFTRAMFFFGLSVAMRHLWSMASHMNLQRKAFLVNPNQRFYQNQTIDQVADRSLVVQPLIGEDQVFDIGVTIWARASAEEERAWLKDAGKNVSETQTRLASSLDGPVDIRSFGWQRGWIQNEYQYATMFRVYGHNTTTADALFKIIYSDIAFRQVRLSDVSSTTVNFSIPASYFPDFKQWTGQDSLKAAFTILPKPNSSLNNLKSYSTWIHSSGITPKRAWPFPLGSEENIPKSLGDEATDLLSFVMPLVQSFQVPHPCVNESVQADSSYPIHTSTPFILSRTHIQIIKELEIMSFESFNRSHHIIKSAQCGKSLDPSEIDPNYKKMLMRHRDSEDSMRWVTMCHNRDYYHTGILETLFEFGTPLNDGSNQIEWAYAPYFEANQNGLGPKDFSPIPTQTVCNSSSIDPQDYRTLADPLAFNISDSGLNLSWHITYSGISLSERTIFNAMHSLMAPEDPFYLIKTGSDYQQVMLQDRIDQHNSLFGVYREGNEYGRRRLLLNFLSKSLLIIAGAFDALYWYTRNTTSFISIPGTLLLAVASLVNCEFIIQGRDAWSAYQVLLPPTDDFYFRRPDRFSSLLRISQSFLIVPILLQAIWMSMTALRIELVWPSGSEDTLLRRSIPTLRRIRPNHQERVSERMEKSTMRWRSRIVMIVSLFIAYHFMLPHIPKIAAQLHPDPDPSVLEAKMLYKDLIMKQNIVDPLFVSGKVFQLVLNNSSGFFAGSYRIAAILKFVVLAFDTLHFISWIVGLPESRGGMDATFVIYMALMIIEAWQAVTLPKAVNDVDDEQE